MSLTSRQQLTVVQNALLAPSSYKFFHHLVNAYALIGWLFTNKILLGIYILFTKWATTIHVV